MLADLMLLGLENSQLGMASSSISQQIGSTCSAYRRRLPLASAISSIIHCREDFPNASMFAAEELTSSLLSIQSLMSSKIQTNPGGRLPFTAPAG
jgi:hypothetical protein